jgi:hypothetical protein
MYDNLPMKNKHAARADFGNKSNNPSGHVDPPKKTGTATPTSKLDRMMEIYKSEAGKEIKDYGKMQSISENIKRQEGGAERLQSLTGKTAVTSTGEGMTISDVAKMKGESEAATKKAIQKQHGGIVGEKVRKGLKQ